MMLAADYRDEPLVEEMNEPQRLLSLIVPVRNEELTIEPFLARTIPCLQATLKILGSHSDYEIVFVDDGSTDATLARIIAARLANPRIKSLVFSRNFGKDAALAAGLRYARGDAVIPIDVDLQDPPEIIPELTRKWRDGARVVIGVRHDRSSDDALKRFTAKAFYFLYNKMADRGIERQAGDFRLLDRQVVDVLNELPERARFMKGLFSWVGFETAEVRYVRERRSNGVTNWTYWRLWNFALDGITASTTAPLRIWTYCGMLIGLAAFLYGFFIIGRTVFFGRDMPGYASLMTAILFMGGLNLVALGVLGEYIGRIFNEVKARPLYILKNAIGFEHENSIRPLPRSV